MFLWTRNKLNIMVWKSFYKLCDKTEQYTTEPQNDVDNKLYYYVIQNNICGLCA